MPEIVLGIVQMECLGLCKWSVWDCTNGVLGIVQMAVTRMRMCCAVKKCIPYNATIKTR